MARSISANGEVIYGTSWDNSDYGMLYWRKEGAGFGPAVGRQGCTQNHPDGVAVS